MRVVILLILVTIFQLEIFAQSANDSIVQPKVVQISGVVLASDSLVPAQFVGIFRARDYRGTFSDLSGYFTLPVIAGDTLHFRCIGLKESTFIVPSETEETSLSLVQWMESDTATLPTVYILPYPAPHKLRQEILALDLPGDNYFAFRRSSKNIPTDDLADFSNNAYENATSTLDARYNNGFKSGGNLLSQAAWSEFMKNMKRRKR